MLRLASEHLSPCPDCAPSQTVSGQDLLHAEIVHHEPIADVHDDRLGNVKSRGADTPARPDCPCLQSATADSDPAGAPDSSMNVMTARPVPGPGLPSQQIKLADEQLTVRLRLNRDIADGPVSPMHQKILITLRAPAPASPRRSGSLATM